MGLYHSKYFPMYPYLEIYEKSLLYPEWCKPIYIYSKIEVLASQVMQ